MEAKGQLVFAEKETQKSIAVEIIDDDQWEPDETFFVKLFLCVFPAGNSLVIKKIFRGNGADPRCKIGDRSINQVTIINDGEKETRKNLIFNYK